MLLDYSTRQIPDKIYGSRIEWSSENSGTERKIVVGSDNDT